MILETKPPIFSFAYGIPTGTFIDARKARSFLTIGTATTAAMIVRRLTAPHLATAAIAAMTVARSQSPRR